MRRATENPLEAIEEMLAYNSRDWSLDVTGAWLWAIVYGWGDGDEDDAWDDVARRHSWSAETVARLKRLNAQWNRIAQAERGRGGS